ncbi:MAG: phage integrase N-terminal SAM-like domain-containing protein [Proteobacteria bacterium]|nr:phage integrase N-terminal SAM-like domain-containing protein [Pseudomonadota bacterium]
MTRFESILTKRSVPDPLRNYYKKWLRFYLDFCRKYHHLTATEESLHQFIKKLQEKNQTPEQRKHASDAISLYFDLMQKEAVVGAVIAETSNKPPDILGTSKNHGP